MSSVQLWQQNERFRQLMKVDARGDWGERRMWFYTHNSVLEVLISRHQFRQRKIDEHDLETVHQGEPALEQRRQLGQRGQQQWAVFLTTAWVSANRTKWR